MIRLGVDLSTSDSLRIHRFLPLTHVEGPGARACIWVQGCNLHCPGCAIPTAWPLDGGELMSVETLTQRILDGPAIEGVTFVGGEPFLQAQPLAKLGEALQAHGVSVVTFTGYLLQDLQKAACPDWQALLAVTDLLIDGPFIQELEDYQRPWVGSSNQRYHFLTRRYVDLAETLPSIPNRVEVHIGTDGLVRVNGMAPVAQLRHLLDAVDYPVIPPIR